MNNEKENINQAATSVRENSFGWMLKSLCTRFDKKMQLALQSYDLNRGQFAILMTLFEEDGLTQTEIGKRISMPGYATTRNIDKLEENELLKRHKDKNSRRSFCIRLSSKGKALAPELFLIVKRINENILAPLDNNEIQHFETSLKKIIND